MLLHVIIFLLLRNALAQFVSAPTDLTTAEGYANISVRYKQVPPGICELDPDVKSFSGYADVAPDQHIFFWFFEARNMDPTTAPLTVWLNGGPGASSMIGLFQENGPCMIDSNGNVCNNPYSWSNASNMLYIDQPTQTGLSYSIPAPGYIGQGGLIITLPNNSCPDYAGPSCGTYPYANVTLTSYSASDAASNFWNTLQGFMGVFPQYARDSFNLAAESYGGQYGPIFSEFIEAQNALNSPSAHNISLRTLLIGNGLIDPVIQLPSYYNFTVSPGNTYDFFPFNDSVAAEMHDIMFGPGNCLDQLYDCANTMDNGVCNEAFMICAIGESYLKETANRDEYDIRELSPDPFPPPFYSQYLNEPRVQSAIGSFVNYTMVSSVVFDLFEMYNYPVHISASDITKLLAQGINIVMYHGDADYICNWIGGEAVANEIGAPGFSTAGYVDLSTSDGVVHGQVKQSGSFTFVRVYEAGHEVPFYQPLASLAIFERAISGVDIATGTVAVSDNYQTIGTATSDFHEGNATVQFHVVSRNATYNTTTNEPNHSGGNEDSE